MLSEKVKLSLKLGKQLKQLGLTLIELLIVIVILGIVVAGASELLAQGFRTFFTEKNYINANWQGRIAIERLSRDLRTIRSPIDISTATNSQLSFTDISGNFITYCLNGTQLLIGNQSSCSGQVLTDGISSFAFTYYDADGNASPSGNSLIRYIMISFSITYYNKTAKFVTTVYPWNLKA